MDASQTDAHTDRRPARLVVVDGESELPALVASALRAEGFAVEVAATGAAAPDQLVVLDVTPPPGDGGVLSAPNRLRYADLELDEDTREVWRNEELLELTVTEFGLLRFFLNHPRRVLSKSRILAEVWHKEIGGNTNLVETYVGYLRRKVDRYGPPLIHTVRGAGYVLRLPRD
jgi:DNA-binding response OmpR family regulator